MPAPTTSRYETTRATLVSALEAITPANNYRSTVAKVETRLLDPNAITSFPTLSVLFPVETFKSIDTTKTTFESKIHVLILAYCRGTQVDALIQDVRRVIVENSLKYVNDANNKWIIEIARDMAGLVISRADLIRLNDVVMLGFTFDIRLMSQTSTF